MKIDWRLSPLDGIASNMLPKGRLLVLARVAAAGVCAATKGTHERLGETDEVVGGI
jgi:hypothetical protein